MPACSHVSRPATELGSARSGPATRSRTSVPVLGPPTSLRRALVFRADRMQHIWLMFQPTPSAQHQVSGESPLALSESVLLSLTLFRR